MSLCLIGIGTNFRARYQGLLKQLPVAAPWLLQLAFTNVLRTACRRGTIEIAAAREIVDQVALLPIRIDAAPPQPR